jgi:hypothetical protein
VKGFIALFFASALVLATQPVFAADSMHGSMMKPTCAAGDSVVGVNTSTKMYMTHDQMKAKMAGMSHDQVHAMMMKHHVKMMCRSQADAMGATMMSGKMQH